MKIQTTPVLVALIGLAGSLAGAWLTASHQAETKTQQVLAVNSTKICSIFKPELWRDNTIVPQTWKADTCKKFSDAMGAWNYQLGCIYDDEVVLGAANTGNGPMRNCGW